MDFIVRKVKVNQRLSLVITTFLLPFFAHIPNAAYQASRSFGRLVPEEEIFLKVFLLYISVAAILVVWLRCGEQTFSSSTNLAPYEI